MGTDYAERAACIREAHDRKLQRIRDQYANRQITGDLRDTLISRNLRTTRENLAQLREADQTERTARKTTLERNLFAPGTKDGTDPATRSTSFRAAREHVTGLTDSNAIREELRQAIRADDTLMQKALLQHCHDLASTTDTGGMSPVIASYINEVRPDLADDYKELLDHTREATSLGARFTREATYLIPSPTEVGRLQDHRIDQVADDPRFADIQ